MKANTITNLIEKCLYSRAACKICEQMSCCCGNIDKMAANSCNFFCMPLCSFIISIRPCHALKVCHWHLVLHLCLENHINLFVRRSTSIMTRARNQNFLLHPVSHSSPEVIECTQVICNAGDDDQANKGWDADCIGLSRSRKIGVILKWLRVYV